MDQLATQAVEASVHAGYPLDAGGILLVEVDGARDGLDDSRARIEAICREHGARTIRVAASALERERLWAGRKGAFAAMGRLSPDYYVQDGVIPRTRLPEILRLVKEAGERHGVRIANVFHAGDGNIHPLIMFDLRNGPEELDRAKEASIDILTACIEAGGSLTGEHGVGMEKNCYMPLQFAPADLAITVRGRSPLADVASALAVAGQFLPLDPPHGERATVGGVIAANANGFWRARYGGVRDLLIGTRTALADGSVVRSGGRV